MFAHIVGLLFSNALEIIISNGPIKLLKLYPNPIPLPQNMSSPLKISVKLSAPKDIFGSSSMLWFL